MSISSSQNLINIKSLPSWDYEKWTHTEEPKQTNSLKEKLLMESLNLIKDDTDNETVCHEIVEQALKAKLFKIAFKAIYTFSSNSTRFFLASITDIFKGMHYWKHFSEEFIDYCEKSVTEAFECKSNWGSGGYFPDLRSRALGYLGRYQFFIGRPEYAVKLWEIADDRRAIDEVIAEMCETIAKKSPQNLEASLILLEMIQIKKIKAKTMAILSNYA